MTESKRIRGASFRRHARQLVLEYLGGVLEASRRELRELTGLSRAAVDAVLAEMTTEGLLEERTAPGSPTVGRPARTFRLLRTPRTTLAIRPQARVFRAALVDVFGTVQAASTIDCLLDEGRERALEKVLAALPKLEQSAGTRAHRVVLDLPTMVDFQRQEIDRDGAREKMPSWSDGLTVDRTAQLFGLPVLIENEAKAATLAEHQLGAAVGLTSAIYVAIGANGIGGGLVLDKKIVRGANGFAGEISHVSVSLTGTICPCGQRGCLAAEIRGQVLQLANATGTNPTLLDERLPPGLADDLATKRLVIDIGGETARAVGSLINVFNPQAVIVADTLTANLDFSVYDSFVEGLTRHVHPGILRRLEVRSAQLGTDASVRGTGLLEAPTHVTGNTSPSLPK